MSRDDAMAYRREMKRELRRILRDYGSPETREALDRVEAMEAKERRSAMGLRRETSPDALTLREKVRAFMTGLRRGFLLPGRWGLPVVGAVLVVHALLRLFGVVP